MCFLVFPSDPHPLMPDFKTISIVKLILNLKTKMKNQLFNKPRKELKVMFDSLSRDCLTGQVFIDDHD